MKRESVDNIHYHRKEHISEYCSNRQHAKTKKVLFSINLKTKNSTD